MLDSESLASEDDLDVLDPKKVARLGAKLPPEAEGKRLPAHTWIRFGGRHYDLSTPLGVKSFLDLPIYAKALKKLSSSPR